MLPEKLCEYRSLEGDSFGKLRLAVLWLNSGQRHRDNPAKKTGPFRGP